MRSLLIARPGDRRLLPLCLLALTAMATGPLAAAQYFVDGAAGNDANSGASSGSPVKTIRKGIEKLSAGDTLFIRGGTGGGTLTYSETFSLLKSGTASAPITLKSHPDEKVLVSHSGTIEIKGSYLVIDGLAFDHQGQTSQSFIWTGSHNTLRNSEVRNGKRNGIVIRRPAANTLIERCVIRDFKVIPREDCHGIATNLGSIDSSQPPISDLRIINNTIYDCSGDCMQMFSDGAIFPPDASHDVLIEGNHLYTTLGTNSENALDFKEGVQMTIRNNLMHGFTGNKAMVFQKYHEDIVVERNTIFHSEHGVEFRMEDTTVPSPGITVAHNVIYDINLTQYGYALKFSGVKDVSVYNNTVVDTQPKTFDISDCAGADIRNNLVYRSGSNSVSGLSGAQFSHNGWFNASAGSLRGANDVTGTDPLFLDFAANNFRLAPGSLAIDRGIYVGYPFTGLAPDLGAHELGQAERDTVPPAPPTGLRLR